MLVSYMRLRFKSEHFLAETILPIFTHLFVLWYVCLRVVCLLRSTDFDVIWQVTHCVR